MSLVWGRDTPQGSPKVGGEGGWPRRRPTGPPACGTSAASTTYRNGHREPARQFEAGALTPPAQDHSTRASRPAARSDGLKRLAHGPGSGARREPELAADLAGRVFRRSDVHVEEPLACEHDLRRREVPRARGAAPTRRAEMN